MNRIKIATILNFIITIFVTIATIFMMSGIYFMGEEYSLTETGVGSMKFFTVQSNILMGIVAFLFVIFEILVINGKMREFPTWGYILKHIFTVGVVLTFLTTALFLAPTAKTGYFTLFKNSNLFFHFIIPILSMITFVVFEKTDKIKYKYVFAGVIPMLLYGIFYTINVFIHTEDGVISQKYDWYGFVAGGISSIFIVFPIMLITTYLISFFIWKLNKK